MGVIAKIPVISMFFDRPFQGGIRLEDENPHYGKPTFDPLDFASYPYHADEWNAYDENDVSILMIVANHADRLEQSLRKRDSRLLIYAKKKYWVNSQALKCIRKDNMFLKRKIRSYRQACKLVDAPTPEYKSMLEKYRLAAELPRGSRTGKVKEFLQEFQELDKDIQRRLKMCVTVPLSDFTWDASSTKLVA